MGKKRDYLTIQNKAEILKSLEVGKKPKELANELNCSVSFFSKLRKNSLAIKAAADQEIKLGLKSKKTLKKEKFAKVHIGLYIWLVQERRKKNFVSDIMLQAIANKFKRSFYNDPEAVSSGFIQKFKRNRNLKKIKSSGEKRAANKEAVIPYKQYFKELVERLGLSLDQLYNADKSALLYRYLPESSICLPHESGSDVEGKLLLIL